jgi:phosphatidylserine decarboxylase
MYRKTMQKNRSRDLYDSHDSHVLYVIDRKTKKKEIEKISAKSFLLFLYGYGPCWTKKIASFFLFFIGRMPFFSRLYAFWKNFSFTKKSIPNFISNFSINSEEFEKKEFCSFRDFFVRKLKKTARPISQGQKIAILPADARYLVFPKLKKIEHFFIKGKKFSLKGFLQDSKLAKTFENGSMVIARLAPADYHRFHFPFSCTPSKTKEIKGDLYSVSPLAIKKDPSIFWRNKREITQLESSIFGTVLCIEIGATFVGSIHQTFVPNKVYEKGEEKGFFDLGASTIVLLFEKEKIQFDEDLLKNSKNDIETKALFGSSLGKALS